ncbi:MAG: hypothetical protein AAGD88_10995 [Bacteroidota bacterium]
MNHKGKLRKRLLFEGFMTVIVALAPLLTYSHKYFPDGEQVIEFLFFTITANGFGDAPTAFYYYLTKIVPLMLLIIWFVSSKNWWYHAILIPMSMYAFQLFSALYNTSDHVDENEIFYVIAVTMVIVPVVYFIRIKLVDKHVHGIDLDAMDTELQILKEKEELRKEREKLEQRKESLSKKA